MTIDASALDLNRRAREETGALVARVAADDLLSSTPCAGWDLRALLEHMIGQNHGFAAAVEGAGHGDVDVAAFAPCPLPEGGRTPAYGPWATSVERVGAAFDIVDADAEVLIPEVDPAHRVPVATVLGMHLLDTVVHGWDVARALGRAYRPSEPLVAAVAAAAPRVPGGDARQVPGAAFGPVRPRSPGDDPWDAALALLGRAEDGSPAARSRP